MSFQFLQLQPNTMFTFNRKSILCLYLAVSTSFSVLSHNITVKDRIFKSKSPLFYNESLENSEESLINFVLEDDDTDPGMNPPELGRRGGRGSGGSFAFASAGGGIGWVNTGGGIYTLGKGWVPDKGVKNKHYNPSVNKYGGGGPINFNPSGGGGIPPKPIPGSNSGGGRIPQTDILNGNGGTASESTVRIVACISDQCQDFVYCASQTYSFLRARERCCLLPNRANVKGICCSGVYPRQDNAAGRAFGRYATDKVTVPDISQSSLASAAEKGYAYKDTYDRIEDRLLELNIVVQKGTPEHGHLQFFQTTPEAIRLARDTFLAIKACNYMQDTYFLTSQEAGIGLQSYDFGGTVFEKICPSAPRCHTNARYRTFDGSCNNPTSPKLGQASTPLLRLLPPDYADGIWSPRVRKDGTPLPSARFVSRSLVPDADIPDPRYSHLLMQFGQFIDHDLSHVPIMRFNDDSHSGIQCCGDAPSDLTHPACFPIDIPPGDSYLERPCMNFVRSMIAPRLDCTFGHADQLNQLTHWLDGSQIYGNSYDQAESLREFQGGLLRVTRNHHGTQDLLPEDGNEDHECQGNRNNVNNLQCFMAGDKRVNEQIGLTSIHTIFLREHNRIATELSHINPHWEDELLFQETRRIVVAEYQHIVYNEWLPIIIGREYMETFGILPVYNGYYNGYDAGVDASVSNAFTTAAFRLHTLVNGMFNLESGSGNTVGTLLLRDFFNNPHLLREPGVIDLLNKGFLTQPIQRFDNFITTELRDHLFQANGDEGGAGMDLIALNIQRGRDHGLPSYNEYRDLCRIGKARDFSDLVPSIHPRKVAGLEQIYGSVDDIDLFIGGIHETPLPDAVVGPTFACIIGDQFVRSKRGDRYFYDHGGQSHSFSPGQLQAIRRVSIARIWCDNSDEIRSVQPLAFYLPNNGFNPMLPCGSPSIPRLDLNMWRA